VCAFPWKWEPAAWYIAVKLDKVLFARPGANMSAPNPTEDALSVLARAATLMNPQLQMPTIIKHNYTRKRKRAEVEPDPGNIHANVVNIDAGIHYLTVIAHTFRDVGEQYNRLVNEVVTTRARINELEKELAVMRQIAYGRKR
jgi:hypothetical protein